MRKLRRETKSHPDSENKAFDLLTQHLSDKGVKESDILSVETTIAQSNGRYYAEATYWTSEEEL